MREDVITKVAIFFLVGIHGRGNNTIIGRKGDPIILEAIVILRNVQRFFLVLRQQPHNKQKDEKEDDTAAEAATEPGQAPSSAATTFHLFCFFTFATTHFFAAFQAQKVQTSLLVSPGFFRQGGIITRCQVIQFIIVVGQPRAAAHGAQGSLGFGEPTLAATVGVIAAVGAVIAISARVTSISRIVGEIIIIVTVIAIKVLLFILESFGLFRFGIITIKRGHHFHCSSTKLGGIITTGSTGGASLLFIKGFFIWFRLVSSSEKGFLTMLVFLPLFLLLLFAATGALSFFLVFKGLRHLFLRVLFRVFHVNGYHGILFRTSIRSPGFARRWRWCLLLVII
mmetsp:Transcript_31395/g.65548  ORF Transcript_31395/g.65548 Transcript_31395/m.65548 type:complete len:339 (+) Transcript_31395:3305-4321(+)